MHECSINRFDGITYINLAMRPDRKEKIEKAFDKLSLNQEKIQRIEAHFDELNGTRGCALSHLDALNLAIEENWKSVLVLEDDCRFIEDQCQINNYINDFFEHFGENWDVFFLGTDVLLSDKTTHSKYLRVIFSMCAHSYAVNGPYIEKLRNHFFETWKSMEKDIFYLTAFTKAIDRSWIELQRSDRWFVGSNMITNQEDGYSDIEKKRKPKH